MTVAQSNALFLIVVGLLVGLTALLAWGKLMRSWNVYWIWVFAPLWIPVALLGGTMFLYQWERGLLPWQH